MLEINKWTPFFFFLQNYTISFVLGVMKSNISNNLPTIIICSLHILLSFRAHTNTHTNATCKHTYIHKRFKKLIIWTQSKEVRDFANIVKGTIDVLHQHMPMTQIVATVRLLVDCLMVPTYINYYWSNWFFPKS